MTRARAVLVLAALLVVLGAVGTVVETISVFESKDVGQRQWPSGWLPGAPRLDRLSGFLEQSAALLPDDSIVAVDSTVFEAGDLHYFRMWCAYLLPRHRVIERGQLGDHERPAYLVSYPGLYGELAGVVELARDAETSLHRLE